MFDIFYKKNCNKELFDFFTDNSKNRITNMQNYIPIYSRFFSLSEANNNKINLIINTLLQKLKVKKAKINLRYL